MRQAADSTTVHDTTSLVGWIGLLGAAVAGLVLVLLGQRRRGGASTTAAAPEPTGNAPDGESLRDASIEAELQEMLAEARADASPTVPR